MEFNLTRFNKLVKRNFVLTYKSLIGYAAATFILGFIFAYFVRNNETSDSGRLASVLIFTSLYILVFIGADSFSDYKSKRKSIVTIMLPSSTEEKWLMSFLYSYIVLPVLAYALLFLGSIVGELIFIQKLIQTPDLWSAFTNGIFTIDSFIYGYAFVSVLFFGSLFYKKLSIFKTAGSIFAVFVIYMILQITAFKGMFSKIGKSFIGNESELFEYAFSFDYSTDCLYKILFGTIAVFFTTLSYIRLKKEEQA